jgi:hypothetical protein
MPNDFSKQKLLSFLQFISMLPNNSTHSCIVDNIQAFYSSDYSPNPSVPNSDPSAI